MSTRTVTVPHLYAQGILAALTFTSLAALTRPNDVDQLLQKIGAAVDFPNLGHAARMGEVGDRFAATFPTPTLPADDMPEVLGAVVYTRRCSLMIGAPGAHEPKAAEGTELMLKWILAWWKAGDAGERSNGHAPGTG